MSRSKKMEEYLSKNINNVGLLLIIVLLSMYTFNTGNVAKTYQAYSKDLIQDIDKLEEEIDKIYNLNRIIIDNTNLIGEEIPFINKLIKEKTGKKVVAVSKTNESVYARTRMNGILKSINNINDDLFLAYFSDYQVLSINRPKAKYFVVDSIDIYKSELITPIMFILSDNNRILQAFSIYENIDEDSIQFIINIMRY